MLYGQSSADPVQPRLERRLLLQQEEAGRNQELNSRLQMKADELERLFAEHKQRRARGAAGDHRRENINSERWRSIGCSRGELYERYMEKRESKLRKEEWEGGLKREERSAAMKALRESLERTTAELRLQQELRSSTTIVMKRDTRDQLVKKNFSEKEEEEDEEEEEQSDTYSYKSVNSKLLPTRRTMSSSSVGRNSNSSLNRAIPRPSPSATVVTATGNSARGSGSGSGSGSKNSSDARKENTKPSISIAGSKPSTNLARSKSTSSTGLSSSSSSTPSRKISATPLKPLTVLPKEQSGPAARAEKPKSAAHDDVGASSPTASSAALASGRTRKKWASVAGPDAASCQPPRKDTGIKRLLQFGRKKKQGGESVVDAECSPAGGARDDREDGAAEVVMSKSRLETNFSDGAIALEQGVPRSFFSLPPFHNREGDSKLGR